MELNKIQSSGSWGKAADDLNQNFSKVNNAVEQVKNATTRNKGYFSSDTELKSAFPSANVGDIAYVGSAYPYAIWKWNGSAWANSGSTGGEESVNLGDYYTKGETDEKFTEADEKLSELGQELGLLNNIILEQGGIYTTGELAGSNSDVTNRVRTKDYLHGYFDIHTRTGIKIFSVIYYNKQTLTFDSAVDVNSHFMRIGKDGCVARVVLSKDDSTQDVLIEDVKPSLVMESFEKALDALSIDMLLLEQGGIYTVGELAGSNSGATNRVRTKGFLSGTNTLRVPDGFDIFAVFYYNEQTLKYDSSVNVRESKYTYGKEGCVARVVFAKKDPTQDISTNEIYTIETLSELDQRISELDEFNLYNSKIYGSAVKFNYDYELKDLNARMDWFDMNNVSIRVRTMEYVYDKFDELMRRYPNNIEKLDVGEHLGLEYPDYANLNGEANGIYSPTPTYRTYMYHIKGEARYANAGHSSNHKPKILMVGGTHGQEVLSQIVLTLIAEEMLDLSDSELYKLMSAFDVYIIPCLCGYGIYHSLRTNYEHNKGGVDINRNYPTSSWVLQGDNTINYSGPYAGSEFETKIVMGIYNELKPIVALDMHHYGNDDRNFYFGTIQHHVKRIAYQNLCDFSWIAKKEFPQYFGTNPDLVPGLIAHDGKIPATATWFCENGVIAGGTCEVTSTFNFYDGIYIQPGLDAYSERIFSIAEWQMKRAILKCAEYAYSHLSRSVGVAQ